MSPKAASRSLAVACAIGWIGTWTTPRAAASTGSGTAVADTIHLAITPSDTAITPGDEFDLHLRVPVSGKGFNAYDAIVEYDPAALVFVPRPASAQEGSLMRGACMNTFHLFHAAGDSLVVNHSLLCQGVTLYGPGIVYNLRFRASTTPQATEVRIRYVEFYDAGIYARPVVVTNSTMSIGPPVDVGPDAAGALRLEAAPNPFRPATVLFVDAGLSGPQSLIVHDARGRALRVLESGIFGPGTRRILWDGRDARGVRLASGVYWVTLDAAGREVTRRVVLVE